LIGCHNRGGRIKNDKLENHNRQKLGEDAVPQDSASDRIALDFGQDVAENRDKRKVVNGNGQGNSHNVDQLAGSGNTNDGEEDIPKNDVVQKFIAPHPPILTYVIEIIPIMEI